MPRAGCALLPWACRLGRDPSFAVCLCFCLRPFFCAAPVMLPPPCCPPPCSELGYSSRRMVSRAYHDSLFMAQASKIEVLAELLK